MAIEIDNEITALRRSILRMAADVEQRIARVVRALLEEDLESARDVATGDAIVDRMDLDIEAECMQILALSQPVARDLRFVIAVLRIETGLERIGDMATSMAQRIFNLREQVPVETPEPLREMARATADLVNRTVSSLVEEDAHQARQICIDDKQIDKLERRVMEWGVAEFARDVEATNATIDLITIARQLERIADVATNIAEDVVFFTEGKVIRHVGASELTKDQQRFPG